MSMFKTLQSNPGTITLFHSKAPISNVLLSQLKTHSLKPAKDEAKSKSLWARIETGFGLNHEEGVNYTIEDSKLVTPTYDQLKLIRSYTFTAQTNNKNPRSHNLDVFRHAFPLFKEISEGGHGLVNEEEFIELVKHADWFVEPLVVDWDKGTLANDEASLGRLLNEYEHE